MKVDGLGEVGYISALDRRGIELDPRAITDGRNVECVNGALQPVKGFEFITYTDVLPIYADYAINSTGSWWVIFDANYAYSYDGVNQTQIGDGFSVNPTDNLHFSTSFDGILCVTDGTQPPQAQYDSAAPQATNSQTAMIDLPGWNDGEVCRILIAHKNYLIAANITNANAFLPNGVRWSNKAAPGNLPDTWVPAADNDAGEIAIIGADSGAIVSAELLRDIVVLYTETQTWALEYIGGEEIYRARRLFKDLGIYGPRCVVEYKGRHYVLTETDVVVHDGNSWQSIADKRVRRFIQEITQDANKGYVFLYLDSNASEIGIAYHPDALPEPAIESLVYNIATDTWNVPRDEPETYWKKDLPSVVAISSEDVLKWDDEPAGDDTWDTGFDLPAIIGESELLGVFFLYGGTADNQIVQFDRGNKMEWRGNTNTDGYPVCHVEQQDIDLAGLNRTARTKKMYPVLWTETGSVEVYSGYQYEINDGFTWDGPYAFDPAAESEVDLNEEGRLHGVRVRVADGTQFRWRGYAIDFADTGLYA